MTEAWTGRKYRSNSIGSITEILSESFVWKARTYVNFERPSASSLGVMGVAPIEHFENSELYTRIRAPKFAVGDKVNDGYDDYTIEAVSQSPDKDGDFGYIIRDESGDFDFAQQVDDYKKVSE
jgi:hypothetical protein